MALRRIGARSALPFSLEAARLHLRVDADDEDELIMRLMAAAADEAELLTQRGIGVSTWRLTLDAFPQGAIALGMPPVQSIVSLQYVDVDGVLQAVAPAALDVALDDEPALVSPPSGAWPATATRNAAVRVEFTAGWPASEVPAPVVQWMLLRIGSLYEHREADATQAPAPVEFVSRMLDPYRVYA